MQLNIINTKALLFKAPISFRAERTLIRYYLKSPSLHMSLQLLLNNGECQTQSAKVLAVLQKTTQDDFRVTPQPTKM